MISCVVECAFEVHGEYASFEEIPYEVLLAAMKGRIERLSVDPDADAFNCIDETMIP